MFPPDVSIISHRPGILHRNKEGWTLGPPLNQTLSYLTLLDCDSDRLVFGTRGNSHSEKTILKTGPSLREVQIVVVVNICLLEAASSDSARGVVVGLRWGGGCNSDTALVRLDTDGELLAGESCQGELHHSGALLVAIDISDRISLDRFTMKLGKVGEEVLKHVVKDATSEKARPGWPGVSGKSSGHNFPPCS